MVASQGRRITMKELQLLSTFKIWEHIESEWIDLEFWVSLVPWGFHSLLAGQIWCSYWRGNAQRGDGWGGQMGPWSSIARLCSCFRFKRNLECFGEKNLLKHNENSCHWVPLFDFTPLILRQHWSFATTVRRHLWSPVLQHVFGKCWGTWSLAMPNQQWASSFHLFSHIKEDPSTRKNLPSWRLWPIRVAMWIRFSRSTLMASLRLNFALRYQVVCYSENLLFYFFSGFTGMPFCTLKFLFSPQLRISGMLGLWGTLGGW